MSTSFRWFFVFGVWFSFGWHQDYAWNHEDLWVCWQGKWMVWLPSHDAFIKHVGWYPWQWQDIDQYPVVSSKHIHLLAQQGLSLSWRHSSSFIALKKDYQHSSLYGLSAASVLCGIIKTFDMTVIVKCHSMLWKTTIIMPCGQGQGRWPCTCQGCATVMGDMQYSNRRLYIVPYRNW